MLPSRTDILNAAAAASQPVCVASCRRRRNAQQPQTRAMSQHPRSRRPPPPAAPNLFLLHFQRDGRQLLVQLDLDVGQAGGDALPSRQLIQEQLLLQLTHVTSQNLRAQGRGGGVHGVLPPSSWPWAWLPWLPEPGETASCEACNEVVCALRDHLAHWVHGQAAAQHFPGCAVIGSFVFVRVGVRRHAKGGLQRPAWT